jgi:hypothetical protein
MFVLTLLLTLAGAPPPQPRRCSVSATAALPELIGTWQLVMTGGLDRPHPESTAATATIAPTLDACLLQERVVATGDAAPYEALVLWGVNGPDGSIQRVFVHSQHGRFGVYEGPRRGAEILLLQLDTQPAGTLIQNRVTIGDRDHVEILSRMSTDGGASWTPLSSWRYTRMSN